MTKIWSSELHFWVRGLDMQMTTRHAAVFVERDIIMSMIGLDLLFGGMLSRSATAHAGKAAYLEFELYCSRPSCWPFSARSENEFGIYCWTSSFHLSILRALLSAPTGKRFGVLQLLHRISNSSAQDFAPFLLRFTRAAVLLRPSTRSESQRLQMVCLTLGNKRIWAFRDTART